MLIRLALRVRGYYLGLLASECILRPVIGRRENITEHVAGRMSWVRRFHGYNDWYSPRSRFAFHQPAGAIAGKGGICQRRTTLNREPCAAQGKQYTSAGPATHRPG
jgi:hypothetical protein